MITFTELCNVEEAVLNIGDKSAGYPKFNQILILAGGGGSGKGFVLDKFLAFSGKNFNVDDLKETILKYKPKTFVDKLEAATGRYIDSFSMSNPDDVSILHQFFKQEKIAEKMMYTFFTNARLSKDRKPNCIFDVTLKNIEKLKEIYELAMLGGYKKENIHIVWILNDFNVALQQNAQRERSVSDKILFKAHSGVSMTMEELISKNEEYRKYADGDIWLFPNKANVDNKLAKSETGNLTIPLFYTAIKLKERSKSIENIQVLKEKIVSIINSYVPKNSIWK